MDSQYKDIHSQADHLHAKFKDICDDRSNPLSQTIIVKSKEVVEDIERSRHPRAVEDRIKDIQRILQQLKSQPETILSYGDIETLWHGYEKVREALRRLPNY